MTNDNIVYTAVRHGTSGLNWKCVSGECYCFVLIFLMLTSVTSLSSEIQSELHGTDITKRHISYIMSY